MTTSTPLTNAATSGHTEADVRPASPARDPNLDLLRATAIAMVLVFHAAQFWTIRNETVNRLASLGQFGVELFFVLSGWLIGGLYWRERAATGTVDLRRFWYRRWLRTVPPYYAGLALAYTAVWAGRREAFDPAYLFFVQNYYPKIPYFVVSWSLCVEEQFYLLLPLLLLAFIRARALPVLLAIAVLLPVGLRAWTGWHWPGWPAGAYRTHLRCDGLALGVFCSYLRVTHPALWARFQGVARVLVLPAVAAFLSIAMWPRDAYFGFGLTVVVLTFTLALAAVAERRPIPGARNPAVFHLAIWSYSIYLTHNLALLAGSRISARFPGAPAIVHVFAWLAAAVATGWIFFRAIELPAMRWRDRRVPRGRGAGGAVDASEALRGPAGGPGGERSAD